MAEVDTHQSAVLVIRSRCTDSAGCGFFMRIQAEGVSGGRVEVQEERTDI